MPGTPQGVGQHPWVAGPAPPSWRAQMGRAGQRRRGRRWERRSLDVYYSSAASVACHLLRLRGGRAAAAERGCAAPLLLSHLGCHGSGGGTPGHPRAPRGTPGTVRDGPAALRVMPHGVGASRQGKGKGIARPGSSVGTSKAQPRAGSGHSQSRGAAAAHVWGIRASKPRAGCSSLEHGMQAHPVSKQHLHPLTF